MSRDLYRVPAHRYDLAGVMKTVTGGEVDQAGNYTSGRFQGQNANTVNAIGAGVSLAGGMIGGAIGGGMESTAGNIIGGLGDVASMIPGPYGAAIGAGLKVLGGITNAAFGSKINEENVNNVKNNISALNNFKSDVGSFDALSENINSQPTAMRFDKSYIGKDGWFANKASNLYNDLVKRQTEAEQFVNNSIMNNMNNLVTSQAQNLQSTFAAHGGPLSTKGADWNSGLNYIGNGGTHEQNPNEGVPMGIAPDGLPNLVEEGEVIWNGDYVFSQRLKVPKSFKEKYKLGKDKPMSYAEAALKFNEEMDEMPNDSIAKRGRDANLSRLAESQEEKRAKIQAREQRKQAEQMALMGMADVPEAQIPIEESAIPEEQLAAEMNQGVPMESQVAAKGGPIGHRYDNGSVKWPVDADIDDYWGYWWGQQDLPTFDLTPKPKPSLMLRKGGLGKEYYDWLTRLSDAQYADLLGTIYPNSGNTKDNYKKYLNDRAGLFNWANTGEPGTAYNGIRDAALQSNPDMNGRPLLTSSGLFDDAHLDGSIPLMSSTDWYRNLPVVVGNNPETDVIIPATARNGADAVPTDTGRTSPIIKTKSNSYYDPLSKLRYAPVVGSALGVFSDLMGWTNKPDYSAADALSASTRGLRNVSFTPIGDYAAYRPVDRMNMVNQLNANAGATRRNIVNTTGGNRGTAIAGLLAADNAFNNSIGQAYINAENANWDRYITALRHNADINKFNSQGFLQADAANQRMDEVRARYSALAADARARALQQASAARSANLTNLFNNLGAVGIDAANRMDTRWLAQYWPGAIAPSSHGNARIVGYRTGMNGEQLPIYGAKGGKLNKRRRRRII